jgi:pyruvoyl-dependent arginine decarboxylase (PvlArgDC)
MLAIQIATGTGAGPTKLAAFDAALLDAGSPTTTCSAFRR